MQNHRTQPTEAPPPETGNRILVRRALSALALIYAVAAFWSPTAQASFGNCTDPHYLTHFDSRLAARRDVHCSVAGTPIALVTASGTVHVRIARLADDGYPSESETIATVGNAVGAVVRAARRLSPFSMDDTTILVGDTDSPGALSENFGTYAATADWTDTHGRDGECYITLWRVGAHGSPEEAGPVIAHELFHCIEAATLSRAQMATYGAPGSDDPNAKWWAEGAADWFSTLALPAPDYVHEFVDRFDKESPDTPLYKMRDAAVVFFDWLGQTQNPEDIIPFLRQMAARPGAEAQREAMSEALSADDWLQFARDYLEKSITDGRGSSIHSEPEEGAEWELGHPMFKRLSLRPFVLTRIPMSFDPCDIWTVSVIPRKSGAVSIRSGWTDSWHSPPVSLEGSNGHTFAGMNAGNNALKINAIAVKTEDRCEHEHEHKHKHKHEHEHEHEHEHGTGGHNGGTNSRTTGAGSPPPPTKRCPQMRAVDRCLVGRWQLTSGGIGAMMKKEAPHGPGHCGPNATCSLSTDITGHPVLVLNPNGSYRHTQVYKLSQKSGTEQNDGEGWGGTTVNQLKIENSGRWYAKDGHLKLCSAAGKSEFRGLKYHDWDRYAIQHRDGERELVTKKKSRRPVPKVAGAGGEYLSDFSYTCSGNVLKLTGPGPGFAALRSMGFFPILYQKTGSGQNH